MLDKKWQKRLLRKSGTAVCLVAAAAMAVGPTAAYAATGAATEAPASGMQLQEVGEEGYEYDISKSTTVSVTGTEGNVYTGEALDPIFLADSANGSLSEYSKSTTRPDDNWFTSAYLVEYENNTNAGTASYTITGGKDLGASDWASKYTGVLKGTFEIAKADLAQAKSVELADGEKGTYLADGNAIAPKLKIAFKSHMGWTPDYSSQIEVSIIWRPTMTGRMCIATQRVKSSTKSRRRASIPLKLLRRART